MNDNMTTDDFDARYCMFQDLLYEWAMRMSLEGLEMFFEGMKQDLDEIQMKVERAKEEAGTAPSLPRGAV